MGERKILSSDFASLKAKVKAEMLRRSKSGSVAAYGGTGYDYAAAPADGGPLLGEHLKKILEPMKAVNPDGLPGYPGGLTDGEMEAMEARVAAWAARSLTDRSGSDCKAGCTGTCYTGCATGCSSCGAACSTGCVGCGSGCEDTCAGCGSGCPTACSDCGTACTDGCTGCGSGCPRGCSSCGSGCQTSCAACSSECGTACLASCQTQCTSGGR